MNRRGLEISMANPVNETISYQTHYVAASRGEGRAGGGRCQGKGFPEHRDTGLAGEQGSSERGSARQPGLYFYFRAELSITRVTFTTK